MSNIFGVFIIVIALSPCNTTVLILRDLIQFNLVGHPVLHKDVPYYFDPEGGIKRAHQYQQLNGVRGEKAIERLGLGIDGNHQERLARQRIRDEGRLGGLIA